MAKQLNSLLLAAFANANPSYKDRLVAGSVSDVSKVDQSENYTGVIKDADGNVISSDATWKPGNLKGVLSLDSDVKITELDKAGDTAGLFQDADGKVFIVLHEGATLADLSTIIGFEFAEDQAVIDVEQNLVEFATHLFTENVALTVIAAEFVNHVDLPVA